MVEFNLKVNPAQKVTWLPKEVVDAWGYQLKLLPSNSAGIIFPKEARYDVVIQSVELLLQELRLRADSKKEQVLEEGR